MWNYYHPRPYEPTSWGYRPKTVIPTYDNRPMGHHNVNAVIHHNLPTDAYGMVSEVYTHLPMLEKVYYELKLIREVAQNFNAIESCYANAMAIATVAKNMTAVKEVYNNMSNVTTMNSELQAIREDISAMSEQLQQVLSQSNPTNP